MAVPVAVIKAIATAATDKRAQKAAAVLIAALLMPIIILILLICSLVSGTENANQNLLDYSFKGTSISEDFTEEQQEAIEDMRNNLEELDTEISDSKYSLDANMVRAVFYCMQFGKEADDFDYDNFCECFDGLTVGQLDEALENVGEEFPQYEITENVKVAAENVYKYLKT